MENIKQRLYDPALITEQYQHNEREKIAEYIDMICSPYYTYGWASTGIYVFWNTSTKEILYIGLAVDLAQRFRKHNGINSNNSSGCKLEEIRNHFNSNKYLGYSIFVQSTLSQPILPKIFNKHRRDQIDLIAEDFKDMFKEGWEEIKLVEGLLIEAFNKKHSKLPKWNKIGGSIEGKNYRYNALSLLHLFNLTADNQILARSSLREIANNSTIEVFEEFLHNIRLRSFRFGLDFSEQFMNVECFYNERKRIIEQNYLEKYPSLMGV